MFPEGCPPFPGPGNSVAPQDQDRSRCVHEHDGGDRAARGHGGYGGGAVSARLRGIARETEQIVAAGAYRAPDGRKVYLADAVAAARAGTRIHGPSCRTTLSAARRTAPAGRGCGRGAAGPTAGSRR
ncbi:hypothetical protein ABT382_37005, partial [Streptomyces pharetrae]